MNSIEGLEAYARKTLSLGPEIRGELVPFAGRGSDRTYFRFRWETAHSVILARYQSSRKENSFYADIARFLEGLRIPVPHILHHDASEGLLIQEDLGDTDLWTMRNEPWEVRRELYRRTLCAVQALHAYPAQSVDDRVPLMEGFGPELYRWERDYFREHFVVALCGVKLDEAMAQALEAELSGLADALCRHRRSLIHRDLQSQNVMVRDGNPFLIDFQGMRFGSRFYDLGSLLCDPYVRFAAAERMDLLECYYDLEALPEPETEGSWESFQLSFWMASAQRLMQALGAYAFLSRVKGLPHYLEHVPAGLMNLQMTARACRSLPQLETTCRRCEAALRSSGTLKDDCGASGENRRSQP